MSGPQRIETLSASSAGMTRLRDKGAALPTTLYELTNGYVDASKSPTQRPGMAWKFNYADPALGKSGNAGKTKGLATFGGKLVTFSHTALTSGGSAYPIIVLRHPTSTTATLAKIHFAQPFMGYLYVVAEFSDGLVSHYWLQNAGVATTASFTIAAAHYFVTFPVSSTTGLFAGAFISVSDGSHTIIGTVSSVSGLNVTVLTDTTPLGFPGTMASGAAVNTGVWKENAMHKANDIVQPTAPNGFFYQAVQITNPAAWSPLLQHKLFDAVQPTTYNGFGYTVTAFYGSTTINTSSNFTITALGASFTVSVGSVTGLSVGSSISIQNGSYAVSGTITNIFSLTLTVTTLTIAIGAVGNVISAGASVTSNVCRSGSTEPVWKTSIGAITYEFSAATAPPSPANPPIAPAREPPETDPGGRYSNPFRNPNVRIP